MPVSYTHLATHADLCHNIAFFWQYSCMVSATHLTIYCFLDTSRHLIFNYIFATTASINPLNNGWGLSGLDLNSGWNWHATNQSNWGNSTTSANIPSGDIPENTRPFSAILSIYSLLTSYLCLWRSEDVYKRQNKCLEQYEKMKSEYNFISIDGTKSVNEIHSIMNNEVQKILDSGVLY